MHWPAKESKCRNRRRAWHNEPVNDSLDVIMWCRVTDQRFIPHSVTEIMNEVLLEGRTDTLLPTKHSLLKMDISFFYWVCLLFIVVWLVTWFLLLYVLIYRFLWWLGLFISLICKYLLLEMFSFYLFYSLKLCLSYIIVTIL